MQEKRNSIANALELRLSCTNPSTYVFPAALYQRGMKTSCNQSATNWKHRSKWHQHTTPSWRRWQTTRTGWVRRSRLWDERSRWVVRWCRQNKRCNSIMWVRENICINGLMQDCGISSVGYHSPTLVHQYHWDGLVQERRNSIAIALELRLSYTNPLIISNP